MLFRSLGVELPLTKTVEVAGLAGMVEVVGLLVTGFLQYQQGSLMRTPSPAFWLPEFDPTNRVHLLLGAVNPFHL